MTDLSKFPFEYQELFTSILKTRESADKGILLRPDTVHERNIYLCDTNIVFQSKRKIDMYVY